MGASQNGKANEFEDLEERRQQAVDTCWGLLLNIHGPREECDARKLLSRP
jgi:FtsZ-binding cell division protein ZapB